jgi:putative radical SAM enzyme (TIGR03279 family)
MLEISFTALTSSSFLMNCRCNRIYIIQGKESANASLFREMKNGALSLVPFRFLMRVISGIMYFFIRRPHVDFRPDVLNYNYNDNGNQSNKSAGCITHGNFWKKRAGPIMRGRGLTIHSVAKGLPAWKAGLRKGDVVLSINDDPVTDEVDFRFGTAQPVSEIRVLRKAAPLTKLLKRSPGTLVGVRFTDQGLARCSNHCIFCFIDQMPKGLRRSLYIKDEDARHSFANGNYVTLGAMTFEELEQICCLGLSPLYVSVHATDLRVRRTMLGNMHVPDIMRQLGFLEKNGISFHTQIVVCPGFNTGAILARSLDDLCSFTKGLLSIAVVPVGLTRYRRNILKHVDRDEALRICTHVMSESEKDRRRHGRRRIFLADEMFVLAGLSIPSRSYYEDYPQIENGVGLVRSLLDEWKNIKRNHIRKPSGQAARKYSRRRRVLIVTSESAYPFIKKIAVRICGIFPGVVAEAFAVRNEFFGGKVTVAGLLTGSDIIKQVKEAKAGWGRIVLPGIIFNHRGHTLDGYSAERIRKSLGVRVAVVHSLAELVPLL